MDHEDRLDKPRCACSGLTKSYGKLKVLDGCTMSIAAGEVVGLVGENGSGKTTLLRCLLGFARSSGGWVRLPGSIGYCPQENALNDAYTVAEHLALTETICGQHTVIDSDYVARLVSELRLGPHLGVRISNLSGGTYQKVKLITCLYYRPDLVLLDEPYDGFDWQAYRVFWQLILEMKRNQCGVLAASHLFYDLGRFDKVYHLRNGKLEQTA